jgi:hypothetical protein
VSTPPAPTVPVSAGSSASTSAVPSGQSVVTARVSGPFEVLSATSALSAALSRRKT